MSEPFQLSFKEGDVCPFYYYDDYATDDGQRCTLDQNLNIEKNKYSGFCELCVECMFLHDVVLTLKERDNE